MSRLKSPDSFAGRIRSRLAASPLTLKEIHAAIGGDYAVACATVRRLYLHGHAGRVPGVFPITYCDPRRKDAVMWSAGEDLRKMNRPHKTDPAEGLESDVYALLREGARTRQTLSQTLKRAPEEVSNTLNALRQKLLVTREGRSMGANGRWCHRWSAA